MADESTQAGEDDSKDSVREWLSPKEFVGYSGLSIATVRRLVKYGLPKAQPGGRGHRILIPKSALEQLLAEEVLDPDEQPPGASKTRPAKRLSGPRPKWKKPKYNNRR